MQHSECIQSKLFSLSVFGIAMGFLEAIVVVYLRQLYYPEGFGFPLRKAIADGLSLEYFREIATIVMLLSLSMLAGRKPYERFAYSLYCFGIWDIFYYAGLKILLNWPSSLFTWDILFLIPVIWIAPVLAPILCAATMIIISGFILHYHKKGYPVSINFPEWSLLSSGALLILITFIWDYSKIIIQGGFYKNISALATDPHFQSIVTTYVPNIYNWSLFAMGEFLIVCFLILFIRRMRSNRQTFPENIR